jgi:hypothetical protein
MQSLSLFSQNRHPSLNIRRLKFGGEAPFEAGYEPLLQICYLAGRAIARQNDLLTAVEQGVKSVEKLLLRTLFASKKMDIVDQQNVRLAVSLAEFNQCIVLDCVNELVREFFA